MYKKHRNNTNRLIKTLESNIYDNNLPDLIRNFNLLSIDEFDYHKKSLLVFALKCASKECAIFLLDKDIICNTHNIPYICKYYKIHSVCNLIQELSIKYPNNLINFHIDKKILINRLVGNNSKIIENPHRIEYLLENIDFFEMENIEYTLSIISNKSLLREIKLKLLFNEMKKAE